MATCTWNYWATTDCTTATTTTSNAIVVWDTWCSPDSTGSTTCPSSRHAYGGDGTSATWHIWVSTTSGGSIAYARNYNEAPVDVLHDAHVAEYRQHLYRLERERRKAAERRAEDLLLQLLDADQRQQFQKHDHFVVHGRTRRYRLRRGRTANIDVICPKGRIEHRLCIHPRDDVPDCDTLVAQKLMIEADEDQMLRIANRHESFVRGRVLPALQ